MKKLITITFIMLSSTVIANTYTCKTTKFTSPSKRILGFDQVLTIKIDKSKKSKIFSNGTLVTSIEVTKKALKTSSGTKYLADDGSYELNLNQISNKEIFVEFKENASADESVVYEGNCTLSKS